MVMQGGELLYKKGRKGAFEIKRGKEVLARPYMRQANREPLIEEEECRKNELAAQGERFQRTPKGFRRVKPPGP